MTQPQLKNFLNKFVQSFQSDIPLIDLKSTTAVVSANDKKASIEEFNTFVHMNNIYDHYTGVYRYGFTPEEARLYSNSVDKYGGVHSIIIYPSKHVLGDFYIEENECYAAFTNPINAYKFVLEVNKIE